MYCEGFFVRIHVPVDGDFKSFYRKVRLGTLKKSEKGFLLFLFYVIMVDGPAVDQSKPMYPVCCKIRIQ